MRTVYYTLGNTLYPLKVSGKPVSEEEHTVTLFYAVPISVEGIAPCTAHRSVINSYSISIVDCVSQIQWCRGLAFIMWLTLLITAMGATHWSMHTGINTPLVLAPIAISQALP